MNRLNILHINKYYAPHIGGVEHIVRSLCEGLSDRADVHALVCNDKWQQAIETINGVEVVRAATMTEMFSMPVSFQFIRQMRKLSKRADIVHVHMPFPLGDVGYLLSGYGGKLVVSWHSDIVRQRRLLKLYKPLMRAFLRRADRIIVATRGHIEGSEQLAPYRDKCVVVPYGMDAEQYVQNAVPRRVLPPKKEGVADVLFVGRLVYYKGVDVLLRAMARVKNAQLTIVGDGPLYKELATLANGLGIAGRVHFIGRRSDDEIKACLRDCDMLALPSIQNSEAFGLVQLQAMCYAKPVVNTALSTGVPLVCVHNQHGLTVQPGDAASMADALVKLADDGDYAKALGKNGWARVREVFTLRAMIDGVYEQYRQLLDGKRCGNNKTAGNPAVDA